MIDNHLHLQDSRFSDDLDPVLTRADSVGVTAWAVNGTSPDDWSLVMHLAERDKRIIPCLGLHPWQVNTWHERDWKSPLSQGLQQTNTAIGEIGLDCWIKDHNLEAQIQVFRFQLELACELSRPVSIHCLRAWDSVMIELKRIAPLPRDFLIHGYGGPVELIPEWVSLGAYISFAGSVLDERKQRARHALAAVPLDRLLVETDAPDMPPPPPYRFDSPVITSEPYRNEPANLPAIVNGIASLRSQDPKTFSAQVHTNALHFWRGYL